MLEVIKNQTAVAGKISSLIKAGVNTTSPYHQCPRFNKCSVNVCPLDPDKRQRNFIPGESVCTLAKPIRLKLGESLPWKGLTPRELAGRKTWEPIGKSKGSPKGQDGTVSSET